MDDDVNVDIEVDVYVVYVDDDGDIDVNVDVDCMKRETVWYESRRGFVTREKLHVVKSIIT